MPKEKLVRDLIPTFLATKNIVAKTRIATGAEYPVFLRAKLLEEVHEFIDVESVEELADVLEVIDALMELYQIDAAMVAHVRQQKAKKKGTFKSRILMEISRK